MNKLLSLTLVLVLSACSLQEIKTDDLVHNIRHLTINEEQIQSANYCTMGFINLEDKRYMYYDTNDDRFKYYDSYILNKCVLVQTSDTLIFLPRKGSKIGCPESLIINNNDLTGIGLYMTAKYRQIHLKTQHKTVVLELLKTTGFPDTESADALFTHLRATGTHVFDIEQLALPVSPSVSTFHW